MKKKFYVTPEMEEMVMDDSFVLSSVVSSQDPLIGYGGDDATGEKDPQ